MTRHAASTLGFALVLVLSAACGGSRYGYAHAYEATDGEGPYLERAAEMSYEEVRRARPENQRMVGWFGVVAEPPTFDGGNARLVLSLRAHQDRHLCSTSSSDSCRVTVSEREVGRFVAIVPVRAEDREAGPRRLWVGSLVKVYGTSVGDTSVEEGPTLQAEWYRHWPVHFYVTTGSAGAMRR